jgi:hypothetical protein
MQRWLLAGAFWLGFGALCLSALATSQSLPLLREQGGLTASARVDGETLKIRVLDGAALYSGIVHAYLVRKDLQHLYFQYPDEVQTGQYSLNLPPMEAGVYDLIVEITGGGGHEHDAPRFVQVFNLNVAVTASAKLTELRRLELQRVTPSVKAVGQSSSFDLTALLDGQPIAWNPYYVHQFVLKTDWSYFKHDHPKNLRELGVGSVRSNFKFPSSGEYVVYQFLETGVRVGTQNLRPVLRLPGVVQIP